MIVGWWCVVLVVGVCGTVGVSVGCVGCECGVCGLCVGWGRVWVGGCLWGWGCVI